MKATYKSHQDCRTCLDLGWVDNKNAESCARCNELHIHTVEVLEVGVGLFGDKAVIKDIKTGRLDTVSIKSLRIVGEAEDAESDI